DGFAVFTGEDGLEVLARLQAVFRLEDCRRGFIARVRGLLCKSELLALQILDFFDPRTWIGDDLHLIAVAVVRMGHHGERFETGAGNGDRVPTCIEACHMEPTCAHGLDLCPIGLYRGTL